MGEEPEWSEPEVEVDEWTAGEKRELEKLEQKAEERRAREEREAKELAERRALEPSPEVINVKPPSLTVTGTTGSTGRQVASGSHSPRAAITALSDWSRSKTRVNSCQGCRRTKSRCDRVVGGCTNCRQRELECVYDGNPPNLRPEAIGLSVIERNKQEIARLRARTDNLASQLRLSEAEVQSIKLEAEKKYNAYVSKGQRPPDPIAPFLRDQGRPPPPGQHRQHRTLALPSASLPPPRSRDPGAPGANRPIHNFGKQAMKVPPSLIQRQQQWHHRAPPPHVARHPSAQPSPPPAPASGGTSHAPRVQNYTVRTDSLSAGPMDVPVPYAQSRGNLPPHYGTSYASLSTQGLVPPHIIQHRPPAPPSAPPQAALMRPSAAPQPAPKSTSRPPLPPPPQHKSRSRLHHSSHRTRPLTFDPDDVIHRRGSDATVEALNADAYQPSSKRGPSPIPLPPRLTLPPIRTLLPPPPSTSSTPHEPRTGLRNFSATTATSWFERPLLAHPPQPTTSSTTSATHQEISPVVAHSINEPGSATIPSFESAPKRKRSDSAPAAVSVRSSSVAVSVDGYEGIKRECEREEESEELKELRSTASSPTSTRSGRACRRRSIVEVVVERRSSMSKRSKV